MVSISASEARARLSELLDLVASGDEVTIERHGRPIAVLVSPDALRSRRADLVFSQAEHIRVMLDEAAGASLGEKWIEPERADELVSDIRRHRRRG